MDILAAGDVINITMDGLTAYQPAAGVEIYVLKTFRANTWGVYVGFQNGVTTSSNYNGATNSTANRAADWNKFCITNAEYYYVSASVAGSGFSGIQIK
jgi:hypothetical protein